MQPHYEKVAVLFNGADAVHSGIIFMARVDCALKVQCSVLSRCYKFIILVASGVLKDSGILTETCEYLFELFCFSFCPSRISK